VVIHSDFVYTFLHRRVYENPTEKIDLRCFTYLHKEITIEPSSGNAQGKLSRFKRTFSSNVDHHEMDDEANGELMHLLLLSDLNRDDTFIFKCNTPSDQTHWVRHFERALEYRCDLISTVLPPPILKYIVSLYFLSFERLRLSAVSRHFEHLFSAPYYHHQYHYYHDALYWSQHFRTFCKLKSSKKKMSGLQSALSPSKMQQQTEEDSLSLEELQFSPSTFHLTAGHWRHLTKDDERMLKYFFIFYHEFAALHYQRLQITLSNQYQRSRSRNRSHRDGPRSSKHRHSDHRHNDRTQNGKSSSHRHRERVRNGHSDVRDMSRRYSEQSDCGSISGDVFVSEEIGEELKVLEDKYENIRLDGYDWNQFFNQWVSYPFVASLCVSCNIETLCLGATSLYDDDESMMTQFVNNAIDQKMDDAMNRQEVVYRKYNQSNFWDSGGIRWFCDIVRHSHALTSHLCTIQTLSLRDSNFSDDHLRLFCRAINSRKYGLCKPFTIRKLVLSKNKRITDGAMQLLFTTIGNKLSFLEELELNDVSITDQMAPMMVEFYREFHFNHNLIQLHTVSLLGNHFTKRGFGIMNQLFEQNIIDEDKFNDGHRKTFHLGVNGKRSDIRDALYDMRLHIVVSTINISRRDK